VLADKFVNIRPADCAVTTDVRADRYQWRNTVVMVGALGSCEQRIQFFRCSELNALQW
jgi:hypothetical protein